MIPRDTLKGTYFPIPLEPGDKLVKDVTNITGSGGGTGNTVRIEGKGTRTIPDWKLQPPKDIGKDYKKLLNHLVVKGRGTLKTQTLGEVSLLGAEEPDAICGRSVAFVGSLVNKHDRMKLLGRKILFYMGIPQNRITEEETIEHKGKRYRVDLIGSPVVGFGSDNFRIAIVTKVG